VAKRSGSLVLALVVALEAVPAGADAIFDSGDIPVATSQDGRFYLGFGASAYFFHGPERENVGALYEENDFVQRVDIHDFSPDDDTPLYGVVAGVVLVPGPGPGGRDLRTELTAHYFDAQDARSVVRTPDMFTDFLAIDGAGHVDDTVSPDDPVWNRFSARYRYFDVGALVRSDVVLAGDVVLTPSLGLALARLDEHHSLEFLDIVDRQRFNRIREDVETWYGGPTLGGRLHVPVGAGLSLQLGGTAWLSYAHSQYRGTQHFLVEPGRATENDSRNDFAFRAIASLGAAWQAGPFAVGVSGGVDYWDYVPIIRHPEAPLGAPYDQIFETEHAGLESGVMTNYFAGVTVSVRLP